MTTDPLWDDLFHGCAWAAYFDQAAEEQGWPNSEATRRRAYRYYEEALAGRNALKHSAPPSQCQALGSGLKRAKVES